MVHLGVHIETGLQGQIASGLKHLVDSGIGVKNLYIVLMDEVVEHEAYCLKGLAISHSCCGS